MEKKKTFSAATKMGSPPVPQPLSAPSSRDNYLLQELKKVQNELALLKASIAVKDEKGRDLSSITNELWRKFYSRKFGPESVNLVVERMKKKKVSFRWHLLYQAKLKEQDEVQKKCVDRLRQLYKEADIQKQSRQTQLCTKVPPSAKRKTLQFGGGSNNQFNHIKGRLMKKSRIEFAASEAKMPKSNSQQMPSKVLLHRPGSLPFNTGKSASGSGNATVSKSTPTRMAGPRN
ncbi:hypothetical protein L7F22_062457 [Adiantum nelumboides]|nr:hypothetical protein [Adiantum nelumboides]